MTIDFEAAVKLVETHLARAEQAMNEFGSGEKSDRLVIVLAQEYEFGWVFFYDSARHQHTDDIHDALAGNAPLIADRFDGRLYVTGTAEPLDHYIAEYRKGRRVPAGSV